MKFLNSDGLPCKFTKEYSFEKFRMYTHAGTAARHLAAHKCEK